MPREVKGDGRQGRPPDGGGENPVPAPNERIMRAADAVVLRFLGTAQGLLSLLWLAATPFMFTYGGAAANPTGFQLWILLWLSGLVIAACVFSVRLWARLSAFVWNGTVLCLGVVALVRERHPSDAAQAWVAASALATAYLLMSSTVLLANAYRRSADRPGTRRRVLYVATVAALVLVAARLLYVASHTQRALVAKLDSRSEDTRCAAAKQLAAQGRGATVALPKLVAMLGNTMCVRWGMDMLPGYVEAIGGIDPFLDVVKNDSGRAARAAVGRLMYGEHQSVSTSRLVAAYVDGLHNRDDIARSMAAEALSTMGTAAAQAAPDLIRALDDPNDRVRRFAAAALQRMRSPDGLRAILASPDSIVRLTARDWRDRVARGDTLYR